MTTLPDPNSPPTHAELLLALEAAFRGDGPPWKRYSSSAISRMLILEGPVELWLELRPRQSSELHTCALVWPRIWRRSHLSALRLTPDRHARCPVVRRRFHSRALLGAPVVEHPGAPALEMLCEWLATMCRLETLLTRLWDHETNDLEAPGEPGSVLRLAAETELAIELGDPWRQIAAERVGEALERASGATPLNRRPSEERDLTQLLVRLSLTPETAKRAFGNGEPPE